MNVLEVKGISKVFGEGHTAVTAVRDVNLTVKPGDIVLIMGPSGSGKTTLLSMAGTLLHPTKGEILVNDQDVLKMSSKELANLRLHDLGFMFQSFNLLSALTAVQNVMVPLRMAGVSRNQAHAKSIALLKRLHLGERLNNLPEDLSGGEKQRVAVARALANDPKLILADEPTANLDSKTGHEVMQLLCEIACMEGKAVIIVSHDERLKDVAKRVITIEDGRLKKEEVGNHNKNCGMKH